MSEEQRRPRRRRRSRRQPGQERDSQQDQRPVATAGQNPAGPARDGRNGPGDRDGPGNSRPPKAKPAPRSPKGTAKTGRPRPGTQPGRPTQNRPERAAERPSERSGERSSGHPASRPEPLQRLRLAEDCLKALDLLPSVLDEAAPLNPRHRQELGRSVRSLWEDLTSEKEHRAAEYLSAPAHGSAYLRYFLPWNLIRLCSILPDAPIQLEDGASVLDLGSGPLTLPIALYLSRPDLRAKRLTVYCADRTERILEAGRQVFESLCARISGALPPWKIILLHQQIGDPVPERVDLVTAANVFNEFFWKSKAPLGMRASMTARQLLGLLKGSGSVFLMEPGDPRSGAFISALRAALSSFGAPPAAPCPHAYSCPFPGIFRSLETPGGEGPSDFGGKPARELVMPRHRDKYPWCHFNIGTASAPGWLKALSEEAGLSKDKLVFSYLLSTVPTELPGFAAPRGQAQPGAGVRVISEEFALPGKALGRYACSAEGYTLLRYEASGGRPESGDLLDLKVPSKGRAIDEKSGAILVSY